MGLVNLTPHDISVFDPEGGVLSVLPRSEEVARAEESVHQESSHEGLPVVHMVYGPVRGLPSPVPGTALVVSQIVALCCPSRDDLLVPVSPSYDAAGRINGCRGLARSMVFRHE